MRRTLVKQGLFACLILVMFGGYFLLERHERKQNHEHDQSRRFLSWPLEEIALFSFRGNTESDITIFKKEQGKWILTSAPWPIDQKVVRDFLSSILDMSRSESISSISPTTDRERYGISEDGFFLSLQRENGATRSYYFGDPHPLGEGMYVEQLDTSLNSPHPSLSKGEQPTPDRHLIDAVFFTVAQAPFDDLKKGVSPFLDYRILPIDSTRITQFDLSYAETKVISAQKTDSSDKAWVLTYPKNTRADHAQIDILLSALSGLRWEIPPQSHAPDHIFSNDAYGILLSLLPQSGESQSETVMLLFKPDPRLNKLHIGFSQNNQFRSYYTLPLKGDGLSADLTWRALSQDAYTTFHHKDVFQFYPWEFHALTLKHGTGMATTWSRQRGEWSLKEGDSTSSSLDPQKETALLDRLIGLTIEKLMPLPNSEIDRARALKQMGLDKDNEHAISGTITYGPEEKKNDLKILSFHCFTDKQGVSFYLLEENDTVWQLKNDCVSLFKEIADKR